MVEIGLESLKKNLPGLLGSARVGLVAHPASIDSEFRHAADVLAEQLGDRLVALFGPQHGARGDKQDNMIESPPFQDPRTGRIVHSLYGQVRKPTEKMLEGLDALVFDLQDVGTRVYTFIWTMMLAMEACAETGKAFVVLDRPNPIDGVRVEGNLLEEEWKSFVGLAPIPMRHGLTVGELAHYLNQTRGIGVELEVVRMSGWKRGMTFEETGLPWVLPSPNMPTLETAEVYPGGVLLEGTLLSEGRGTTRPFEIFGSPELSPGLCDKIAEELEIPGAHLRPCSFEPTFNKGARKLCHGWQMHITNRSALQPLRAFIRILHALHEKAPGVLQWFEGPYEYEFEHLPIDFINGSSTVRHAIEGRESLDQLFLSWESQESLWLRDRKDYLLYD